METNDKLMKLLRLMDEPERVTEAQLEELLSDDEVRKAYDVMADCKKVYQRGARSPKLFILHSSLRKIAAVFIGFLLISGLAFAAIQILTPSSSTEGGTKSTATGAIEAPSGAKAGGVRFDDVRLDSILTVVSAHYGKAVSFRDDEAKGMKFIMTWNPDEPLSDFIDGLNLFDGLSLTLLRDTIFVETAEENL